MSFMLRHDLLLHYLEEGAGVVSYGVVGVDDLKAGVEAPLKVASLVVSLYAPVSVDLVLNVSL